MPQERVALSLGFLRCSGHLWTLTLFLLLLPYTLLSLFVLIPLLSIPCIFQAYDSLRHSTLFSLHLSPNSWGCDVVVSYAYTFRLLVQAQPCLHLKIWENPGWEERFLPTFIIRSPIAWHLWQCPRCSLCLNW